jgi:hypothetical protein
MHARSKATPMLVKVRESKLSVIIAIFFLPALFQKLTQKLILVCLHKMRKRASKNTPAACGAIGVKTPLQGIIEPAPAMTNTRSVSGNPVLFE